MIMRFYFRVAFTTVALGIALAATAAWWLGGAWENSAMPTHGVLKVIALACGALLCFLAAIYVEREKAMVSRSGFHEDLERPRVVETGSDRAFGAVFAAVFTIVALFPLFKGSTPHWWALAVAGLFILAALAMPRILAPLNRLWARFGALLHRIVTPIILGFVFFAVVTPMALLMRVVKKEVIPLTFQPDRDSYWIEREPDAPQPETMKNQF